MRIAALPMYDLPELREQTDALWAALARAMTDEGVPGVPATLDRALHHREVWSHPRLLIAQTCGYPLVRALAGRVRVVATPRYEVPECVGAWYTSRVLVPASSPARTLEDVAGAVCAANEIDSHSGMNGLRALLAPLAGRRGGRFFSRVVWSGGHRASLELLARGEVEVTCVDSISFALTARVRPDLTEGTREIARTVPCPGLPLITPAGASDDEIARMRAAVARVMDEPDTAEVRRDLLLGGVEVLPDGAYHKVVELEEEAVRLGYPALA